MIAPPPQSHHDYTFGDYLVIERDSEVKHEFDAGEILARSGETARHSALAAKIVVALGTTRPPGCTVFQSDMRVRVVATGRATYPDVSMVCGPIEYDPEDPARTTITNPVLLVEVLSVTTEKGDRGNKWMHYQRISSLQEYVLVSQEARVEIFRRTPSGNVGVLRSPRRDRSTVLRAHTRSRSAVRRSSALNRCPTPL